MPDTSTIRSYNEAFKAELERLNPAQLEAVEQIEGPVLVIAGPGTGKTHILAARIGRILMETDAHPHNILCLTFTDAGVQAMRKRLLKLIGPEAHRVHIFTFHSFCNNIIQNNLERFGRRELEPLSDLERVEIIRRIIEELPHTHILKAARGDTFFYEGHLQSLFQQMKKENWDTEYIHRQISTYLDSLPDRDAFIYQRNGRHFKKGDLKKDKIEDEKIRMQKLWEAAALFPRYKQLMREMRRYDYEDMILWVLDAFEKHPSLLQSYQEQYLYFLVDEYQDTNGAQNEVLHRLIHYWDNPNVFIVGDDDQSIYEFQGARLKNIVEFYSKYHANLSLVVLQQNYRSSQPILDTSRQVISRNEIRVINHIRDLGIEKILTASSPDFAKSKIRPVIAEYPDRLQEEVDIVSQLFQLSEAGFPMEEVAVIYSKHRQAERLTELLNKKGISYHTRRSMNILDLPLIQNLRMFLDYLNLEFHKPYSGEHLLFRIMHVEFLGFEPYDLATYSIALSRLSGNEGKPRWRSKLNDKRFLKSLGIRKTAPFFRLFELIEYLLGAYTNLSLPVFMERLINRSGLLSTLLQKTRSKNSKLSASSTEMEALFSFTNFIKKETARNPRLTPGHLLELLKSMDANRIALPIYHQNDADNGGAGRSTGVVNLITAHSSKGLEFQKVFLLDCVKDHWEPSRRGSSFQFSLPDTLVLSGEEDALEARRRLFYVAMTRARESLHISYAASDDNGKELQRAIFVDEILYPDTPANKQSAPGEIQYKQAPGEALAEAFTTLLLEKKPVVEAYDREAIQHILDNFTLSISSMNNYLRCPLGFYYEKILQVPVLASDAARFGIAMHNALYKGFEQMLASEPKHFPSTRVFVQLFEKEMELLQTFFSKKEYERRLEIGKEYMAAYVEAKRKQWRTDVQVEKNYKHVEVNGIPITGTIDRVDILNANTVHITDYKTGSQNKAKIRRPTEKNPEGGNYWRQLVFYKILFENYQSPSRLATSAEISYLEPDAKGKFPVYTLTFEPEDLQKVKELITSTYQKIMNQEFYQGCGEENCPWCGFLIRNEQVDSFVVEEMEELDDER